MRLYRDYKEEKDLQEKKAEDREHLGLPQETVIIYEPSKAEVFVRNFFKILGLLLMITVIVVGVIALAYWCK